MEAWAGEIDPAVLFAMDVVLMVLFAVAIGVGWSVRRKLTRLKAEREEWVQAMTAFTASSDAAQATLAEWQDALRAEEARPLAAAPDPGKPVVPPSPAMALTEDRLAPAPSRAATSSRPSILSMQ